MVRWRTATTEATAPAVATGLADTDLNGGKQQSRATSTQMKLTMISTGIIINVRTEKGIGSFVLAALEFVGADCVDSESVPLGVVEVNLLSEWLKFFGSAKTS
jgi:hypothetical protein